MAVATSSAPDRLMSAITTLAPSPASRSAVARPIPDAEPVTIATLPSTRPIVPPLARPQRLRPQANAVDPGATELALHQHGGRIQRQMGVGQVEAPALLRPDPVRERRH